MHQTDFTKDLKKIDVPRLVIYGEDDQIVPVKHPAEKSARLIKGAKEIHYPGAPQGLTATHQDRVNVDLLAFMDCTRCPSSVLFCPCQLPFAMNPGIPVFDTRLNFCRVWIALISCIASAGRAEMSKFSLARSGVFGAI